MHSKEEFIRVIQENAGLIYKTAKVYTNSREDEQDLYQDIVYQLWRSFGSFRNDAKISTWMYRIALNTAIAHLDKEKRKGDHIPIGEWLLNKPDIRDTVKEERLEVLYTQIKRLNTVEKGIILLYLEGKTYDEMASITGFSATNIGTRLGRIKQKLIAQIN
jgi:RNA polymerase sigma factor (sigma-70 family)